MNTTNGIVLITLYENNKRVPFVHERTVVMKSDGLLLFQPQAVESAARAEEEFEELVRRLASNRRTNSGAARHGQWRPALQSIAETGS